MQAGLEPSPKAQYTCGNGKLKEEQRDDKDEKRANRAQALPSETQLTPQVEEPAEQQGLNDDTASGEGQCSRQDCGCEEAIGAQEKEKLAPRPDRWFFEGGNEFRRKGSWSTCASRCPVCRERPLRRAPPAHVHQHSTP